MVTNNDLVKAGILSPQEKDDAFNRALVKREKQKKQLLFFRSFMGRAIILLSMSLIKYR